MPTANEIVRKAKDYIDQRESLQEFADWFEDIAEAYDDPSTRQLYAAIEGALACYYFDHIGQVALRQELAKAIGPFVFRQKKESAYSLASKRTFSENSQAIPSGVRGYSSLALNPSKGWPHLHLIGLPTPPEIHFALG